MIFSGFFLLFRTIFLDPVVINVLLHPVILYVQFMIDYRYFPCLKGPGGDGQGDIKLLK